MDIGTPVGLHCVINFDRIGNKWKFLDITYEYYEKFSKYIMCWGILNKSFHIHHLTVFFALVSTGANFDTAWKLIICDEVDVCKIDQAYFLRNMAYIKKLIEILNYRWRGKTYMKLIILLNKIW